MIKLWHFINNTDINAKEQFTVCKATGVNSCTISINNKKITYEKITTTDGANVSYNCSFNEETQKNECKTSVIESGIYWITNTGRLTSSEKNNYCSNCSYYGAAIKKCQSSGGHLTNLAELEISRENGKLSTGWYYSYDIDSRTTYQMHSNGSIRKTSVNTTNDFVICVGE